MCANFIVFVLSVYFGMEMMAGGLSGLSHGVYSIISLADEGSSANHSLHSRPQRNLTTSKRRIACSDTARETAVRKPC